MQSALFQMTRRSYGAVLPVHFLVLTAVFLCCHFCNGLLLLLLILLMQTYLASAKSEHTCPVRTLLCLAWRHPPPPAPPAAHHHRRRHQNIISTQCAVRIILLMMSITINIVVAPTLSACLHDAIIWVRCGAMRGWLCRR